MSGLPRGWVEATLSEACDLITDGTHHSPENNPDGEFMYITARHIKKNKVDIRSMTFVDREIHDEIYRRAPVQPKDVLYIKDGATTGTAAVNDIEQPFSLLSSVALLRPAKTLLNSEYLCNWLNADLAKEELVGQMGGSAIRRLTLAKISDHEIKIAPLPEQRRIVAKIDSLSARSSRARDHLDHVPRLMARYKQTILERAFDGTLSADWRGRHNVGPASFRRLSEVAADFSYGSAAKSSPTGCVPVLRMGNIQAGRLAWDDLVFTSDEREIEKFSLQAGDVLFNRTNSPALVGKTALFEGERPAIYAGYLIRIRCHPDLDQRYLTFALNAPVGRDYCWAVKTDGVSQSNISARKIAGFEFLVPSLPEQHEIVRRIETAFAWVDRLAAEASSARRLIDRLDQAVLAKAFRGELVAQDPDDEPASVLLERIRSERAAAPKPSRGRRGRAAP